MSINRMKSEQIADKRKIFELFTTILDVVASYDERQVVFVFVRARPCVCVVAEFFSKGPSAKTVLTGFISIIGF